MNAVSRGLKHKCVSTFRSEITLFSANCGEDGKLTGGLLRCSRCRNEYFCSYQCQKEYWPFHKSSCKLNEFADLISSTDPKFSKWMRDHGRQAVLKDAEIDRLERAGQAFSGVVGRSELLSKMSGRVDPMAAIAPFYTESEKRAVMIREANESSRLSKTDQIKFWNTIEVIEGLGVDTQDYKWRQSLSCIEMFVLLPSGLDVRRDLRVNIETQHLKLVIGPDSSIQGQLLKSIEEKSSSWYVIDGVLHVTLLKSSRKGKGYKKGEDCSSTWWSKLFTASGVLETIPRAFPPSFYYSLPLGDEEEGGQLVRRS